MQTKENIYGDGLGYVSRPTDQLYNISLFFQDYFPGHKRFKVNLKIIYADALPLYPPRGNKPAKPHRDYRRVDIGATYGLVAGQDKVMNKAALKWAKALLFNLEIFNLLDIMNVNSYYWVAVPNGREYAVPNYLTGRLINFRIQVNF